MSRLLLMRLGFRSVVWFRLLSLQEGCVVERVGVWVIVIEIRLQVSCVVHVIKS